MKRFIASIMAAALLVPAGAPLGAAAAENATLGGIDVSPDQVRLHLSDQVKFNTFVTADPPRLVVELLGVEHGSPARTAAGQGKFLKKVRSGQYQREPSLITRIVLDLQKLVAYRSTWSGKDLVVTLTGDGAPADAKDAASPAKADLPETMTTENSEEVSKIAASADVSAGSPAETFAPKAKKPPAVARPVSQDRRDILASLSEEPITLDFDNTDVREVLKLLAAKAKINIVYGSDVSGALTLHLADVPFNEAFTTILSMQGLVANQAGENILRVMTPATLQKERTVSVNQTRVIKLRYSKADEILPAIVAVRAAEQRTGKLVSDAGTNSLIITDTLDGIASVERLLAQLDTRPQQVMIEAKLVEVKLSKGVNFGIQWDYLSMDPGKLGGQQGTNLIGATPVPIAPAPVTLAKPFDKMPLGATIPGVGAASRGTGVSLPADKIFGALTWGRVTNNYFLSATLTAAASQGKVKVLSDPKIATLNGKQATINITTQIPYVTSNVSSTGVQTQTVTYVTTGITLDVTPTINADGRVTLSVSPNVSQPSATASANTQTGAPAIDTRTAKTIVLVQDGETIVIGGLITDSVTNLVAKVPLLGDIPFLGWLFKKKTIQRDRVELLIFVTTKLVPS